MNAWMHECSSLVYRGLSCLLWVLVVLQGLRFFLHHPLGDPFKLRYQGQNLGPSPCKAEATVSPLFLTPLFVKTSQTKCKPLALYDRFSQQLPFPPPPPLPQFAKQTGGQAAGRVRYIMVGGDTFIVVHHKLFRSCGRNTQITEPTNAFQERLQ